MATPLTPFTDDFVRDPYGTLARLREAAPVHHVALPDGTPAWIVTRDAEVRPLLSDDRLSVNKRHSTTGYAGFSLPPALDRNLLNIDPADHLRLRRLVSQGFTPRQVAALRPSISATAERLAGALREDLVAEFATPLPLAVISDLFALPEADRAPFAEWVGTVIAPTGRQATAAAIAAIYRYLTELVAARRAAPGDDPLSALIAARDEGDRLSEDELVSLAFLILGAGIENVQHTISAGLLALSRHPYQVAALQAEPTLVPGAVEELLRYAHPNLMAIRRFATEDLDIAGTEVPAGDTVLLCLASANRDPARYADPETFDVRRTDHAPQLALGHGMHYCLGAPLARLELEITLTTLLPGFPRPAAEAARWRTSFRSHALAALPLHQDRPLTA
ncbi:cytochrome P450 family protein [Streptomyces mayteni]